MIKASTLRRLAGALAVLCIVLLILLTGQPPFTNASTPPRGISSPAIAIQVARDATEVDDILSEAPSLDRETMRFKQHLDFALIPVYLVLFLTLAALLAARGEWFRIAAAAAAVCAVAAAAFNVLENFAVLRLLDISLRQTTPAAINAIRAPSAAKWALGGLTLALLSPYFLLEPEGAPFAKPRLMRVAGAIEVLTAILMLVGLYANQLLVWQFYPLLAWLAAIAALFFRLR